jgi:hypothetical protein
MSPILAAGSPEMMTVGQHAGMMGPPTCGTTPVTMGQVCMSEIRAAGGMRPLRPETSKLRRFRRTRQRTNELDLSGWAGRLRATGAGAEPSRHNITIRPAAGHAAIAIADGLTRSRSPWASRARLSNSSSVAKPIGSVRRAQPPPLRVICTGF